MLGTSYTLSATSKLGFSEAAASRLARVVERAAGA
jgi:hypothetical protein